MLINNFKTGLIRCIFLYAVLYCFCLNTRTFYTTFANLSEIYEKNTDPYANKNGFWNRKLSSNDDHTGDHSMDDHHVDDHHTEGGGTHSIFGSLVTINTELYTTMIILIIGMVLLIEHLFLAFHEVSMDTPFHKMISAIEQELMIVGCTAFIFKVFLNSNTFVDYQTYFALEFAG